MSAEADIVVRREGNLFVFSILTARGREWVEERVELEGWAWLGASSFVVDQHYASDLAAGMQSEGLVVI